MAKKPTKKSEVKVSSKFKREVDVRLTERAKEAKQARVVDALTERKEEIVKMEPFKAKVRELTDEIEQLRAECKAGSEKRNMFCVKEYDFRANVVRVRRVDNREIVEETTMTSDERAEVLPTIVEDPRDRGEPAKTPGEAIREARAARSESAVDGLDDEEPETTAN